MGKGTDKLYVTHGEWASEDAYSASAGSGVSKSSVAGASFKRLPFNFCAVSLQPFTNPVCTADGTNFDIENILPWLEKHGTNPVTGHPLKAGELIKLNFAKNDEAEMVDPVTFKVFTDNTHIVALKNTGNVFAYDTIERLNIKGKMWRDLISDDEFTRKDIITLQDPQNVESRNLSAFKYLQDGTSTLTPSQEAERADPTRNLNTSALGNAARVLKAKEAVAKARSQRSTQNQSSQYPSKSLSTTSRTDNSQKTTPTSSHTTKPTPYNAALHTTGRAAASLTSTGLTPETSNALALLSTEEYMLKPRRVKTKGYARLLTTLGSLNLELDPEFTPRAVWNFVQLSKTGYYNGTIFHRNIRNFMIQGGDPTGTGKGGASIWGKNFSDEIDGPGRHDARGVLSMANKGKHTNGSQFFITYRPAPHLDRKHSVFGKVVGGMETLGRMEGAETGEGGRPKVEIRIEECVVFVDPFVEFERARREREGAERAEEEVRRGGGREDERVTWTGKRVRGDGKGGAGGGDSGGVVGKYLKGGGNGAGVGGEGEDDEIVGEWEDVVDEQPAKKKGKVVGGFGNFDSW